jgi:hypothetical protein
VNTAANDSARSLAPGDRENEETAMDVSLKRQDHAAILTPQSTPDELVRLICKLRWIGMEDEAERLTDELTRRDTAAADSVVAIPHETD